jgi:hypothetical protein
MVEEIKSFKDGVRLLAQDWYVLRDSQPFYVIDKAVNWTWSGVESVSHSTQKTFRALSVSLPFHLQGLGLQNLPTRVEAQSGYYRPELAANVPLGNS